MKIVIDKNIPYIAGVFESFCDVGYFVSEGITSEVVKDADAMIVRTRTRCNSELLKDSKVRFIGTATIGFDHIDESYCVANNIKVETAAGCNARAVAQWVFASLRELRVTGGVLGIVGVGNVGKQVQEMAKERGFEVLLCDPPRAKEEGKDGFVELQELLAKSDVVTMHVPLSESTLGMCDESFFANMNATVFLNASRGEVVKESALKNAIVDGKLQKVALDVWCNEPKIDRKLVEMVQIATPHIAGYSARGKANASMMMVQAVAKYFQIKQLENWRVDFELKFENPDFYDVLKDDAAMRSGADFESLRNRYNYR